VRDGTAEALDVTSVSGGRARWAGPVPAAGTRCLAQLRAHGDALPCVVESAGDDLTVRLAVPARGVAPGQAVVLYDGDRVLGSATIDATR
jgi:tRNA-specific 2-thiouridylase